MRGNESVNDCGGGRRISPGHGLLVVARLAVVGRRRGLPVPGPRVRGAAVAGAVGVVAGAPGAVLVPVRAVHGRRPRVLSEVQRRERALPATGTADLRLLRRGGLRRDGRTLGG